MKMRLLLLGFAAIGWTLSPGSAGAQLECIGNTNPANCPGSFTMPAKTCGVDDPVCTATTDAAMPPQCCTSGVPGGTGGQTCQPGGCNGVNNCRLPDVPTSPTVQIIDNGGGSFTARLKFDVTARWNDWAASHNPSGILTFEWMPGSTVDSCNSNVALCQYAQSDRAACWIEQSGLTCGGAPYDFGPVSVRVSTCSGSFGGCFCQQNPVFCSCWKKVDRAALDFKISKTRLGCVVPPTDPCTAHADSTGASGLSCSACQPAGPGWWVSDDGSPSGAPGIGNAQLRYAAGGVGGDDMPGAAAWRTVFGRYWVHDYAERIVLDPDVDHVWLLTRHGGFHEFESLAGGSGLRLYQSVAPADELRKLYYDTSTQTWQLQGLDGTTEHFRADGQWSKTVSAQDPTHPIQGTYNGSNQLTSISFPDGHSDSFTYSGGKLASISQVAVSGTGTASRTWSFTWSGDELATASRPDGTSYEFHYDSTRPGYLTRVDLVTAGSQHRVVAAFSYLTGTNKVEKSWRGDTSFTGSDAVDKVAFSYSSSTQTVVTRTVSPTFDRVTTYTLDHVAASNGKLRVQGFTGSCPSCGLSPSTTFTYGGANPLLPSAMTDAKGTRTDYTYTAEGRLATKTEAANVTGLTRTTAYTYDTNFPGLATRVEVPSTSGGSNKRRTDSAYDSTTGVLTSRTIDGFEAGSALPSGYKTTSFTYNTSGEVLTVDPPGFSTSDVTSYTYNLTGRNGHVADSRTDPLVGTTTFGYDGLNRRTSVTDVNNVQTTTTYDSMNRVTEVRRLGATSGADLVTTHVYNDFGDLACTKLPRGNGVQYDYDAAGRLIAVTRGTAVTSPTASSCLDAASPRERTAYQLDAAGNRTEESRERWNGSSWVSDSRTAYAFTCHLDKTTLGAGSGTTSVTEYCYDLNGNLEGVWDANHARSTHVNPTQAYEHDELDRLTSVTVGPGTVNAAQTDYTYDVQDHLASVTDAEGNATALTTSDRDLVTQEVSPASGTTTHTYGPHRELLTTTDARGVVAERTVDAADRVTLETFGPSGSPDPELTTGYTYGTSPLLFEVGRLVKIDRGTQGDKIVYTYDRFGRLLQDGDVSYQYDKNGYRTEIAYAGGVTAAYTPDFADRDAALSYDAGSGSQPLVTAASYLSAGPLSSLTLANGLVETRGFDARYFPSGVQAGTIADVDYTVDGVGNPTAAGGPLDGTTLAATYSYEDNLYFLTGATGPWGTRSWTYDKIGNRLTSDGTGLPSWTYQYSASGHGPRLSTVTEPASSTSWDYGYDGAGNQTGITVTAGGVSEQIAAYDYGDDGLMYEFNNGDEGSSSTGMSYDPRRLPAQAMRSGIPRFPVADLPTYSSQGELLALRRSTAGRLGTFHNEDFRYFTFAGRPVAQLSSDTGLVYITTDHLATPFLVTDVSGASISSTWPDPFRALTGLMLQYPGQWTDSALENLHQGTTTDGAIDQLYSNVHRWYQPTTGRYTSPDPAVRQGPFSRYAYADQNPLLIVDPLGLKGVIGVCCEPLASPFSYFRHCYIRRKDLDTGIESTIGLHTDQSVENWIRATWDATIGIVKQNNRFDMTGDKKNCYWDADPCDEKWGCAKQQGLEYYPQVSTYRTLGPNSNTFAAEIAQRCDLNTPPEANPRSAPGWGDPLPPLPTFYYPGPPVR